MMGFVSCRDDEDVQETDYTQYINNVANKVIIDTYEDLAKKADALEASTIALRTNPTNENLIAAKAAWVATRIPWEQSEGFLFGPVDQEGIDPSLDSWPVNVTDLNNVLSSGSNITVAFLNQQEGTLKGFHTLEFLLWGENGAKQVNEITNRQFEYIAACAGALAQDANKLYDLWKTDGNNYLGEVLNAGKNSTVYISQKAVLEEMANGLLVIADEVGNGKINDPFVQEDLTLEESRFSANSKADFADNMRSIQNIYNGTYGNNTAVGSGLYDIVKLKDLSLANQVNAEIQAAISDITQINGTFSSAVFNNKNDIAKAQVSVRKLQETLESKVVPLISAL